MLRHATRSVLPSFAVVHHGVRCASSGTEQQYEENYYRRKQEESREQAKKDASFTGFLRTLPKSVRFLYVISPLLFLLWFVFYTEADYYWGRRGGDSPRVVDEKFLKGDNPWRRKVVVLRDDDDRICGYNIIK